MSANDEEYLDNLLNSLQETDSQTEPLESRFPDRDIVAQLSRDKDREWEASGGNLYKVEKMATEDVISASLENLLAQENTEEYEEKNTAAVEDMSPEEPHVEDTLFVEELKADEPEEAPFVDESLQETPNEEPHVEELTAEISEEKPAVEELVAEISEEEPAVEELTAGISEEEPAVEELTTETSEEEPAMEELTAGISEEEPAVEELTAGIFEEEPAVEELTAGIFEEEPAVEELTVETSEEEPAMEELTAEISEEEPAMEEPVEEGTVEESLTEEIEKEPPMEEELLEETHTEEAWAGETPAEETTEEVQTQPQGVDDMKQMSQDEIEALIQAASMQPEQPEEKAEPELPDDIFASLTADIPESEKAPEEIETDQEQEAGGDGKPKEKTKKRGFFQKLFELFTEEVQEEEPLPDGGFSETNLSEENAAILESLDSEAKADKKAEKKAAKEKAKQEKKEKKEQEKKEKEKAAQEKKAAKPKKPKKEKAPKQAKGKNRNRKVFPKKLIFAVALLALTIFGGVYLITSQVPKLKALSAAREAFYNHDYKEAYESFYGYDLKEKDQILYNQAYSILKMQQRLDAYNSYRSLGMELEALDALMQGVAQYEEVYTYGQTNGASAEISLRYQEILDTLLDVYGINEEEAISIAQEEDDLCYTLHLEAILDGYEYLNPYENLDYYLEKIDKEQDYQPADSTKEIPTSDLESDTLPEEELLQEQISEESVLEEVLPDKQSPEVPVEDDSMDDPGELNEEQYVTQ